MATFLITYDNRPPRDYSRLYQLMAEWKAVRMAESVWLANLVGPAKTIRDIVLARLELNDVVAVVEIQQGSDWATNRVAVSAVDHLSNFVTVAEKAIA